MGMAHSLSADGNAGFSTPTALEPGIDDPLAIEGQGHGLPHTSVVERRPVGAHGDVRLHVGNELGRFQVWPALAHRVLDLHPVGTVDGARKLPAEIVAARQERRGPRGVVLVDHHLDTVDVRKSGHEIVWVADECEADVGPVAVEHPRSRAHDRLGRSEIAELVDTLPRDDRQRDRVRQHVQEPRERFLQHDLHGIAIHRLDLVDGLKHVRAGIALHGQEALDGVAHILGGQLTAVERRFGFRARDPFRGASPRYFRSPRPVSGVACRVPADSAAKLEYICHLIGLGP